MKNKISIFQLTVVTIIVIVTILLVTGSIWLFFNILFPRVSAENGIVQDIFGFYRFSPSQITGFMQLLLSIIAILFLCLLEILPLFIIGYIIFVFVIFATAFTMSMFLNKNEFIQVFGATDSWRRIYPLGHLIKLIRLKYNGD
ncbi:MAG: hypothetical protein WBC22_07820 [Sedimentisphaerales bacterium]